MRTGVNLYPPSAPVVVVSSAPVPSLDKVTLAALMAPPEASETTPEIEPVSTCANDGNAAHRTTNRTDATARTSRPPQKRTDLRCITILLKNLPRAVERPITFSAFRRIEVNDYPSYVLSTQLLPDRIKNSVRNTAPKFFSTKALP